MIDAGTLSNKVDILTLAVDGTDYTWARERFAFASVEEGGRAVFAASGTAARQVKFILRKQALTLHNAFLWRGRHCFITEIVEEDRLHIKVTAALTEPVTFTRCTPSISYNALNNPIRTLPATLTFPACLTEKYLGHQQETPQAVTTTTLVMVTPKLITVAVGDIVADGGMRYQVQIAHELDPYKNEYEITRKEDV